MKKLLIFSLVSALSTAFAPRAFAQVATCNSRCQIDQDCGSGYSCYVGVCRATNCASDQTCSCLGAVATAKPTVTPKAKTIVPAKATPVATASARVKTTPTTGFSLFPLLALALTLTTAGWVLKKQ